MAQDAAWAGQKFRPQKRNKARLKKIGNPLDVFFRRPIKIHAGDEAAFLVHKRDKGRVVHHIATAVKRHFACKSAISARGDIHFFARSGEAGDAGVETVELGFERFRLVAFGVHRDKKCFELIALGPECFIDFADFEKRRGADIRAMGKAEKDEARMTLERRFGDARSPVIGQRKRAPNRIG